MFSTVWTPFEQTLTITIITKPQKEIKTADKLIAKMNVTGKKQNVAKIPSESQRRRRFRNKNDARNEDETKTRNLRA